MSASSDDELSALEANLRGARQHRDAEYERMLEMQREVEALVERASALLRRDRPGAPADDSDR